VPTIRVGEVRFRVYPQDHPPRHLHAFIGDGEVIIDLRTDRTVAVADRRNAVRNATRTEVRRVLSIATGAFDLLVAMWEEMQ
jgi:hypothetical protein